MNLHALSGLPRSGTTLLANVLSQHPDIHVSGTSALPLCLEAVQNILSTAPEVQADLATIPNAYDRYLTAMRGLVDGWYASRPESIIIDKGRGWVMHRALLDQLYPDSIVIVSVRDPRNVVASIEREHRKTAVFSSPLERTIYESAEILMMPDGMVGGPMRFCEDLIRRNHTGVLFVRYESFVMDPATTLARIHDAIRCDTFEHDLINVINQSTDLDALYRGKFPHDGSGQIKPNGRTWHDVLDPDLADKIASRYPLFMQTFSY